MTVTDFMQTHERLMARINDIELHFNIVWCDHPDKPFTGYDGQEGILYFNDGFKLELGGISDIINDKCVHAPTDIKNNTIADFDLVNVPLNKVINLINQMRRK